MTATLNSRCRSGFTLVELLVAMALAITLAAITVSAIQSGALESQRVVKASDRAAGWIIIAKQRALRDGQPRGVRFHRNAENPNFLTEAEYIEQPEPWVPNPTAIPNRARIAFVYWDNMGMTQRDAYFVSEDPTELTEFDNRVRSGDLITLGEFGLVSRVANTTFPITPTTITAGVTATMNNARHLTLASYPDLGNALSSSATQPCYLSYAVSFQLQAQPLFGEPLLQLGADAVIDIRTTPQVTSLHVTVPTTTNYFDIMFSPSGQVLGTTDGLIALWVRDPTRPDSGDPFDYDNAGEQVLVTVYTRTGSVATHPVNPAGSDPHSFAKDGINSGF